MNRSLLMILMSATLLTATLAGCADDKDATTQSQNDPAPTTDSLEQELGAVPSSLLSQAGVLDVNTPFLLSAKAGPDSPISAFLWTIPDGAIIKSTPYQGFNDYEVNGVVFGMVPIFPEANVTLEDFGLLIFRIGRDADLAYGDVGTAITGTQSDLLTSGPISLQGTLGARWITVDAGSLKAGDKLAFVFAAKSAKAGSVGLLFSPQAVEPKDNQEPATTASQLVGGRTVASLPMSGSGVGFQYASYVNFNLMFLTFIMHQELMTDSIQVDDRTRTPTEPAATVRDATISANFASGGFSIGSAVQFIYGLLTPCQANGKFDINIDLHGTTVEHRNLIIGTPVYLPTTLLTGWGFAFAIGEGSGSASTSLDFQVASTCGLEIEVVEQLSLGATLENLTGTASATGGSAFTGLIGNIPPSMMHAQDGDLFIVHGTRTTRLAGLGHVLDPVEEVREMMAAA